MEYKDREKIDYLCNQLLQDIDMTKLWPLLLENKVYNRDDVNIPNWQRNLSNIDTVREICFTIKTRGPRAYVNLIKSLHQSSHQKVADQLESYSKHNGICSSNNNRTEVTAEPVNANESLVEPSNKSSSEPSNNINTEKDFEDDYYTKLIEQFEPLQIKVRKSIEFRDGPEITDIERYIMRSEPRGLVLLITNIEFKCLNDRPSAAFDEKNLTDLFQQMGFTVISYKNLTGKEIKEKVQAFSKRTDLRRVDSVFIIISSHGNGEHGKQETEIQGIDCQMPDYDEVFCTDIIDYFTAVQCPSLQNKPKIFIFQTCRGPSHQRAVQRHQYEVDSVITENPVPMKNKPLCLSSRNYQDTLIAYATLPGHVSYRDTFNGAWFIQILCEVFMNHAHEKHIQDLFTMTDGRLKDLRNKKHGCQTLWVINQGFHKHCYINPGLFKK